MQMKLALALAGPLLAAAASGPAQSQELTGLDELLAVPISTASKLEQTAMRAPASVTILSSEEIERFGWRTLAEAISSVTGLYLSDDHNYAYLGVRGFSRPTDYSNRVLVMIDGLRVREDVFGAAAIGSDLPLDMRAIERIEVVRGPGSVAFGAAAMLAVVNVILRDPETTTQGAAAVEAGDFGRIAGSVRGGSPENHKLRVAWSAVAGESDGDDYFYPEYQTDEPGSGHSRGADWDRGHGVAVRASYASFDLTGYSSERKKGFPTGAFETDLGDRRNATRDSWQVLGVSWAREVAPGWRLFTRGQGGHYAYDGVYMGDGIHYLDSTDNTWWVAEMQATWEPRPESRTTAGIEWRENLRADYRNYDELGVVYFDGDLPHRIAAIYAEHEQQITEGLLVTIGARYDDHSKSEGALSPRVALVYLPSRVDSFKLLAGRAFRSPNIYELADGVSDFQGEASDLQAEKIESFELVWQRRLSPSLFGTLSAFRYQMLDLIDTRVDPVDGLPHYVNVDSATSIGAELELSARFPSGLWIVGGASYQRAEDDGSDERLSNSPDLQLKLKISSPFGSGWRAAAELVHESGRRTVVATTTSSYLLANASLSWTLPARPWTIELQARNLFDRSYFLPGGVEHRQPALEQESRSLTLRFEVRF
jgi:outer membrane receptor protein involved in Fe transport